MSFKGMCARQGTEGRAGKEEDRQPTLLLACCKVHKPLARACCEQD